MSTSREFVYFFKDGAIHTDAGGVEAIRNAVGEIDVPDQNPIIGLARYDGVPIIEHTPEEMAALEKEFEEMKQRMLQIPVPSV